MIQDIGFTDAEEVKVILETLALSSSVSFGIFTFLRWLVRRTAHNLANVAGSADRTAVDKGLTELTEAIQTTHLELTAINKRLDQIEYQLKPNSGGSLRDHVNKLRGQMEVILHDAD